MGTTRPGAWGLYQPALADLVKPASNDFPKMLKSVEDALSLERLLAESDATDMVNEKIKNGNLITGADQRLPQLDANAEIAFSVTDASGHRSWVEADQQGLPTPNAVDGITQRALNPLGITDGADPALVGIPIMDGQGRRAETAISPAGTIYADAANAILQRGTDFGVAGQVGTITQIGDSLTADPANSPVYYTAKHLGCNFIQFGYSGNGSTNIALRAGALPVSVTEQVTVPAGQGATVPVTVSPADGWRETSPTPYHQDHPVNVWCRRDSDQQFIKVPFTLRENVHNDATPVEQFELIRGADTQGPLTIEAGAAMTGTEGDAAGLRDADAAVLFLGRNNIYSPNATLRANTALLRHLRVSGRFLIVTPPATYSQGQNDISRVKVWEHIMADTYGEQRVLRLQSRMATAQACADAGITPTQDDLDMIAQGFTAPSLLADAPVYLHYNALGYQVVGQYIAEVASALGWKG